MFSTVTGVDISGNLNGGSDVLQRPRATRATQALSLAGATQWRFDFSALLVFPPAMAPIQRLVYSVVVDGEGGGFVQHVAHRDGHKVTVELPEPVNATVTVEVAQAN